jgi:xanthine dehydrogenase YagR molybdenum-binding subunit
MVTAWPEKRRIIGTEVKRLAGPVKATGRAKYSFDINRPGLLHAMILRSPQAHCKITRLDASRAEKMPGVKAVHVVKKAGDELYFQGDEIIAVAADTEEHCLDALRAIDVAFEALPFLVKENDALKNDLATAPPLRGSRNNVRPGAGRGQTANVDAGFKNADFTHEGKYGLPLICHQCLESHGLVAEWTNDGGLTVWASTQAVVNTAKQVAGYFRSQGIDLPDSKVKCITHHMGGGFGSKFGPDIQGLVAAELARKAKAPVKLMLNREEEVLVGGNRPSAFGTVKIAGTKDGTITAFEVDTYGSPGVGTASSTVGPLPYVLPIENRRNHTVVRLNLSKHRAMRAPGHPQSCFFTACAVTDLAAQMKMDPMEVFLKNLPKNGKSDRDTDWAVLQNTVYTDEIHIAARLSDWKKKWHLPGEGTRGRLKHGMGMALHTWGGRAQGDPNDCTVFIAGDGSVNAQTSTQDLGTGQRTVTAIVVAEILGLQPRQIDVDLGESDLGRSTGSGGSTTCPSQAPAALRAATAARDELFGMIAGKLGSKKEDLSIQPGKVVDKKRGKEWSWKEACSRLGMATVKGTGFWSAGETFENPNVSNVQVGGVQVAEVLVDPETGLVRCTRIVAVQDCGMVVNKLTCESQVAGGVIMGLNYALFEERVMDRQTGRMCNADMEFYKLGGIEDMPEIIVHMHDMPQRGVIGIGEPPTISTNGAISNAVQNALGVRVPETPFTPDRVLAALARK